MVLNFTKFEHNIGVCEIIKKRNVYFKKLFLYFKCRQLKLF